MSKSLQRILCFFGHHPKESWLAGNALHCKVCNWNLGFSGLRYSPFMYHARGVIARVSKLLVRP